MKVKNMKIADQRKAKYDKNHTVIVALRVAF